MKLSIEVERIIIAGEQYYQVKKMEGKVKNDLPKVYLDHKDSVYLDTLGYMYDKKGTICWRGCQLKKEDMSPLSIKLEKAADLLMRIEDELLYKNRRWKGIQTFTY